MSARLSHLDDKGEARMVDVSAKDVTARTAIAEGFVAMAPETLDLILTGNAPKGDVLATARIAGIMAAKRTSELIPLCHPLPLTQVTVDFEPSRDPPGLRVEAHRQGRGQDRGGDGGADRGLDRLPDDLRHVQGGRSRHVVLRHSPDRKDRRPLRPFPGASVPRQTLMALLSVAEALARVTEGLEPLEAERVPLDQASGRVLAKDLTARLTQPPFDASAMDGYAVRAARRGAASGNAEIGRRIRSRRWLQGTRGNWRSGAHLHRRAGAQRRRHHRHSGGYRHYQ